MGETTFEEWYETPVFESSQDERLEQLATSRRTPIRLLAGAVLRFSAARGGKDDWPDPEPEPATTPAPVRAQPAQSAQPAEPRISRLLDRWADREAATQARLERLMLPRRWRS